MTLSLSLMFASPRLHTIPSADQRILARTALTKMHTFDILPARCRSLPYHTAVYLHTSRTRRRAMSSSASVRSVLQVSGELLSLALFVPKAPGVMHAARRARSDAAALQREHRAWMARCKVQGDVYPTELARSLCAQAPIHERVAVREARFARSAACVHFPSFIRVRQCDDSPWLYIFFLRWQYGACAGADG
jgi:hypothetical protein